MQVDRFAFQKLRDRTLFEFGGIEIGFVPTLLAERHHEYARSQAPA